jgi:immune inhibitor A
MSRRSNTNLGRDLLHARTVLASAAVAAAVLAPAAQAAPRQVDNLPSAQTRQETADRQQALNDQLAGRISKTAKVAKIGHRYVQLKRDRTDQIFVLLVQFGSGAGPLRNNIPAPTPDDNTSLWVPNFNTRHYQDMLFNDDRSLHSFYLEQSSGAYTVKGKAQDWVTVNQPESFYGNDDCGSIVCPSVYLLIRDALAQWTADKRRDGWSDDQIKTYLARFDRWDRHDYDHDGNFNEPDGYLDHLILIHAGKGEEVGGGAEGADAIWSHSSSANQGGFGLVGPDFNKAGGYEFPGIGMWAADYTTEPEDGGLGVFAHEFGHDLGLPDEYDRVGGENSTGWWTLMSQGSYGTDGGPLENQPIEMNAWDKLFLGWLHYDLTTAGDPRTVHRLGPVEGVPLRGTQALITKLPKRTYTVTVNTPFQGSFEWYGGKADNLNNTLSRTIDLSSATTSAELTAKAWYQVEEGFDYVYGEVSTDGGTSWLPIDGTFNGAPLQRDGADNPAMNGDSGGWGDLRYDLSPYLGQTIMFRWRYSTDSGTTWPGFTADVINVNADGASIFSDDVESGDNGWTAVGFTRYAGSVTGDYDNYYIAENRNYVGYDAGLRTSPYNFYDLANHPNTVEHFPYQNGLLVWYYNTFYTDNDTLAHPGEGLILPVDSHQNVLLRSNGTPWRPRVQAFDSTFGLEATDPITLTSFGTTITYPSEPPVSTFNDLLSWYDPARPTTSVIVPATGTKIQVLNSSDNGNYMQVAVGPAS